MDARTGLWAALLAGMASGSCDTVPSRAVTSCELSIASPKTDILFVVDDSGSMNPIQDNLKASFGAFIDRLAASPVRNDYQIGITTTSVDRVETNNVVYSTFAPLTNECSPPPNVGLPFPAGALVSVSGPDDPTQRLQSTTGGTRILSAASLTSAELVAAFQQNVQVGVCGSGKEQGLRAARLAVSDRIDDGANAGFLRPGARLVVVIVSNDDDCSDPKTPPGVPYPAEGTNCENGSEPVQDFVDFFRGSIAGENRPAMVATIVPLVPAAGGGWQPGACGSSEFAGTRYKAFADAFGAQGFLDSVCNASFQDTLVRIASAISQEVPLAAEPADWRLLTVSVEKPDGTQIPCRVDADAGSSPDVVYSPPTSTRPPALDFSGSCTLQAGDRIAVKLLCAG